MGCEQVAMLFISDQVNYLHRFSDFDLPKGSPRFEVPDCYVSLVIGVRMIEESQIEALSRATMTENDGTTFNDVLAERLITCVTLD